MAHAAIKWDALQPRDSAYHFSIGRSAQPWLANCI
jgi:hypothetical protein